MIITVIVFEGFVHIDAREKLCEDLQVFAFRNPIALLSLSFQRYFYQAEPVEY